MRRNGTGILCQNGPCLADSRTYISLSSWYLPALPHFRNVVCPIGPFDIKHHFRDGSFVWGLAHELKSHILLFSHRDKILRLLILRGHSEVNTKILPNARRSCSYICLKEGWVDIETFLRNLRSELWIGKYSFGVRKMYDHIPPTPWKIGAVLMALAHQVNELSLSSRMHAPKQQNS